MKKCILICISLICLNGIIADELLKQQVLELVPQAPFERLLAEKKIQITRYYQPDMEIKLLPKNNIAQQLLNCNKKNGSPGLIVETLYLYKKLEKKEPQTISQILHSISHLAGTEYFSPSRGKMRTLYETSYCIDNPKTKTRISDPKPSKDILSIYALQKDLTFGENIYQYTFYSNDTASGFSVSNYTPLKISFIRIIDPNNLINTLIAYDIGDYILLYGLTRGYLGQYPLFEKKITNSIQARSNALFAWFENEYNKFN